MFPPLKIEFLAMSCMSLKEIQAMPLPMFQLTNARVNKILNDELSYELALLREEFQKLHEKLNREQGMVFDAIIK